MAAPTISLEFFPPKSLQASFLLWDCVQTLGAFEPEFVSVTYGAGGTTRTLTHEAVEAIAATTDVTVAAHLTCVDATKEETLAIADSYRAAGVNHIVALRGDPPNGASNYQPPADGFKGSIDLTAALSGRGFDVTVGSYPETHPDATSAAACIDHLKAKMDAGASRSITQFFFEAETFLRFRDACTAAGITAPILPGILPVVRWSGVQRFASQCGASIPPLLAQAFDNAERDGVTHLMAVAHATELCDTLISEGVEHLHFYTLNTPELTRDICHAVGITPKATLQKVA